MLHAWREGDRAALDAIVAAAYPRLHDVAEVFLSRESKCRTLQATALVNELYLLLRNQRHVITQDREQFYAFAAYLTRLILLNRARERRSQKRGGDAVRVPLNDEVPWADSQSEDVIDLNRAIEDLEVLDPRKARLLELVVFLGCSVGEAAEVVGVSRPTAERDLRFARAWIRGRLSAESGSEKAG